MKQVVKRSKIGTLLLDKLDQEFFYSQKSETLAIHGFEVLIPEKHHLKSILKREPLRENLLAQAAKALLHDKADRFVDVGANIGDSAAVVYGNATASPESILIEPSKFFFDYLKQNQKLFPNSILMQNFVSHEYPIQVLNGKLHHWGGTARYIESQEKMFDELAPPVDLIQLIDEKVKLVKIDCDGMDFKILKSAIPRLEKNYPVFYFENEITTLRQLQESKEVFELFENAGYKYVIVARNCGSLIFGGEIGENLYDILRLQFALHAQGLRSAIYYTDVIVFNEKNQKEYFETISLMRNSQESLLSPKLSGF